MQIVGLPRHLPPTGTPLAPREWWAGYRPSPSSLADFGAALGRYVGAPRVWLASSGRTALRLLLTALQTQPHLQGRTEVLLPGYTCPSVAKVVVDAGLTPRLVDLDPMTLTYMEGGVALAVGPQTLAVMVVHPFGLPVDVAEARAAADAVGAVMVEDAAQALGARLDGRAVGMHGAAGLYSFGPGKPLALGGGGMVATSDEGLAQALAAVWATLPGAAGAWPWARMALFRLAFQPSLWWLATRLGAQRVGDQEASWGYTLTGFAPAQAAVGLRLLPRLDAINAQRRRRAQRLTAALADLPPITLTRHAGGAADATYLRFPLLAATPALADALEQRLWAAGIGVGRMYRRTLPEFFPQLAGPRLPGAERVATTLLTLPTNHHVQDRDLDRMAALVHETTRTA